MTVYPGWLRGTLTFLVPVAFAVTLPAESLTDRLTPAALGVALAFTVFVVVLTWWVWPLGVRHYSGASA